MKVQRILEDPEIQINSSSCLCITKIPSGDFSRSAGDCGAGVPPVASARVPGRIAGSRLAGSRRRTDSLKEKSPPDVVVRRAFCLSNPSRVRDLREVQRAPSFRGFRRSSLLW
jgi:hypothetical protein